MRDKKTPILWVIALCLVAAPCAISQDLANGLEGYWNFDEGEGTVVQDSSSNGRDGSFRNGEPIWYAGKLGNGIYVSGDDDVTVPWKGIGGNSPRSISYWIKTDWAADASNGIVGWGLSTTGEKWHTRLNHDSSNGTVGAIRTEIEGSYIIGSTPINDGQWHHAVCVFEGQFMQDVVHYVDGVEEAMSGTGSDTVEVMTATDTGADLTFGSRLQGAADQYYIGAIDEVRIYSRALSEEDIQALYEDANVNQIIAVRSLHADFAAPGMPVEVTLDIPTPADGALVEILPEGWTAGGISEGGAADGGVITWNLTSAVSSVSYTAEPADGAEANVFSGNFNGLITDGDLQITVLQGAVGEFDFHADIGSVSAAGNAEYNSDAEEYLVTGSGADVWGTADGFHFLFSEFSGPFTIKGNAWIDPGSSTSTSAKGGIMIRNGLSAGSSYGYIFVLTDADLSVSSEARTAEGQSSVTVQASSSDQFGDIEIERNGKIVSFYMLNQAGDRVSMGSITLEDLEDPVYAGLAVTAHENGSLSDLYFIDTEIDLIDLSGIRVASFAGDGQPTFEDVLNVSVNVFTREAGAISVVETPPEGWAVSNIQTSAGEAAMNADGDIEWTVEDQTGEFQLTYDLTVPSSTTDPIIVGQFSGLLNNAEISGDAEIRIAGLLPQDILDQQDVTSGLIAHWTFDEGEGVTAADSSGQGRNAEIWAGDPQWVEGVQGTALEFDGDDGLYIPGWYGIAGGAPRTIMCWIQSTATNTHGILSWGLSSGNGQKEHFRINNTASNGTVGAIRTEIQGTFNIGTTIVNDGEWHFIASVLPEGGQYVVDFQHYVDGLLDQRSGTNDNGTVILIDTAAEEGLSDQEFRIGMSVQGGADRYFPGIIDEVRVYDRGLTNAEIQAIYVLERGDVTSVDNFMLY